jgi:hypothetical protein
VCVRHLLLFCACSSVILQFACTAISLRMEHAWTTVLCFLHHVLTFACTSWMHYPTLAVQLSYVV